MGTKTELNHIFNKLLICIVSLKAWDQARSHLFSKSRENKRQMFATQSVLQTFLNIFYQLGSGLVLLTCGSVLTKALNSGSCRLLGNSTLDVMDLTTNLICA